MKCDSFDSNHTQIKKETAVSMDEYKRQLHAPKILKQAHNEVQFIQFKPWTNKKGNSMPKTHLFETTAMKCNSFDSSHR